MPLFDGVGIPQMNKPGMSADEKITALSNAVYELNEKLRNVMNNLDGDNFTTAYAEGNKSVALLTQKVSALEGSMNDISAFDYVVRQGYEARNNPNNGNRPDSWYVRRWKSGRIEAMYRLRATNADPLTYEAAAGGGYRTFCISYGVIFPFTLASGGSSYLFPTVRGIRSGMTVQTVTYDADGITGLSLWSPFTAAFDMINSQYIDMFIRLEAYPVSPAE